MALSYLIIISCVLVSICSSQQPATLDDLIMNLFNTTSTDNKSGNVFQPTPTQTTVLNPNVPNTNTNTNTGSGNTNTGGHYKSCGLGKECVQRFLCKNDAISTDGVGLIDIRSGVGDPEACEYLEVCCNIPDKTTTPIIPIKPPVQHEGCGYTNPQGVFFKITGDEHNEAQFGEFPWMVAILREEEGAGEILNIYECGGSVLAPNVVLTAAHCVKTRDAATLVVRAGEWDTQTKQELLPHQDRRVQEIVVHEKYNSGALYNDIALLLLAEPFEWQENVRPICLPDSSVNFDHSRCYATGWGKDKFGREGSYQVILKKIDLPVVPSPTCQDYLRATRLGKYFNLHESFICAGGEKDKDTCKGDGGSPLVCPIPGQNGRYYQAGIVAWGIGCGELNLPGVYVNIPFLRQWINDKLNRWNVDYSPFTAT